jgi:hypothetical protein
MKLSPLPYGFRATCRLIKRDLKNLVKRKTQPDGLQQRFHRLDTYKSDSRPAAPAPAIKVPTVVRETQPEIPCTPINRQSAGKLSISTDFTTVSPVTSREPISPSTATEYSSSEASRASSFHRDAYKKLKEWYESRPKDDLTLEERQMLRGVVLVLAIALCYTPENPAYAMLGNSVPCCDDQRATHCKAMLTFLLQPLEGNHRAAAPSIQGFLGTLYSLSTARQLLLDLGAHERPSTRASEIETSLHEKLSALLLPE